jgi:hypothetical protein
MIPSRRTESLLDGNAAGTSPFVSLVSIEIAAERPAVTNYGRVHAVPAAETATPERPMRAPA